MKFWCWLFGAGFVAMLVMANAAIIQRDNARSFKAQLGETALVCHQAKP